MELFYLILILIVIGFLLYLVETKIPMDGTIKLLIQFVIVIAVIWFLFSLFVGGTNPFVLR